MRLKSSEVQITLFMYLFGLDFGVSEARSKSSHFMRRNAICLGVPLWSAMMITHSAKRSRPRGGKRHRVIRYPNTACFDTKHNLVLSCVVSMVGKSDKCFYFASGKDVLAAHRIPETGEPSADRFYST